MAIKGVLHLLRRAFYFARATLKDALALSRHPKEARWLYGVPLYRNALYLMLSSAVLALSGFFFWAVAARLYPVEGVGLASAAISAMGLLALLSTLGLDYGLIRFLPQAGDTSRNMINTCFTAGGIAAIALSLLFLAGLPLWSPALISMRAQPVFFAAFVVFTVGATLQTFTRQTFVAERKAEFALWQGLIFGLVRFIPLVALAGLFHSFGIFASWGIAFGIAVPLGIFLFLPKVQAGYRPLPAVSKQALADMMHFSSTNYAANILWAIPGLVLPLMVVGLLGAESTAYFYIAWAVANILSMIPGAASFSLFAEGSYNQGTLGGDMKRALKLVLVLLIPTIIIISALAGKILLLFGTAYSENATRLLQILAISALPLSLNYIYFSAKRVEMRMKGVVALSGFIVVTTLALSFVLLPRLGILGAGVSYIVAQVVAALVVGGCVFKGGRRHQV